MASIIGLMNKFLQILLVHIRELLDVLASFADCRFAKFLTQWVFVVSAQQLFNRRGVLVQMECELGCYTVAA